MSNCSSGAFLPENHNQNVFRTKGGLSDRREMSTRRPTLRQVAGLIILAMIIIPAIFFQIQILEISKTPFGQSLGFIAVPATLIALLLLFYPFSFLLEEKAHPSSEITDAYVQRQRKPMIDLVRQIWIKGVLEGSLQNIVRIELGLSECRDKVDPFLNISIKQPDSPPRRLPPSSRIIDLFDDVNGSFLILGYPGSGKTTLLLQLAESLLDRADQQTDHKIPVVINLSSWSIHRGPLEDWLVSELERSYQVPTALGRKWVETNSILPLLDGLDEVALDHREECITVINEFKRTRGLLPLVVCSRKSEYESLSGRLHLPTAVSIESLTPDQIKECLARTGQEAIGLDVALENNNELWELLKTPLMLNVVLMAFKSQPDGFSQLKGSLESQRRQIFDYWKKSMFIRPRFTRSNQSAANEWGIKSFLGKTSGRFFKRKAAGFTEEQTEHWLSWLAKSMEIHNQSIFYLERIQPDWLNFQSRISWLVFGLVDGLVLGLVGWLVIGLVLWQVYGLVGGLVLGLILGLVVGIVSGLIDALIGLLTASGDFAKVHLVERLRYELNIVGLAGSLLSRLVAGLVLGPVAGMVIGLVYKMDLGLVAWLVVWMTVGMVAGLVAGLAIGLTTCIVPSELEARLVPNEGIRRSGIIALKSTLLPIIIAILLQIALKSSFVWPSIIKEIPIINVSIITSISTLFGLFALVLFYTYGGGACIYHYSLRFMLWRRNFAPLNYVGFLEYAADRIFLNRVGGGYAFIHRMIQEYFAELEPEKPS